jgi:hypothetical protein
MLEKARWVSGFRRAAMKQIMVMILEFGVFAIPAIAAVNFTATDAGNGKLQIAYTSPEGDTPRGVALRISLSDGAVVDTTAPVIVDPAFNTFPDYAFSNPLNYAVGAGHPLAMATQAGALSADASEFSISMGALDQTGDQKPGPTSTANLITIQLKKGTAAQTTVTISGDTLRGPASGVVGSVLTSNLPITVRLDGDDCGLSCLKCTAPEYSDWIAWGRPACWCYERQCRGDTNGMSFLGRPVTLADLNLFKNLFNQTEAWVKTVPDGICADLNHKPFSGKRVTLADLNEFKKYFNLPLAQVPSCDLSYYNFWFKP